MTEAVSETKEKLDVLKTAEAQVQEQFARGEISQEQYNALQREIAATEQQLKALETQAANSNTVLQQIGIAGEKVQEFGGKVTDAGKSLLPVTAAIGGIGVAAVKTTADFDSSMSKVKAISGATGEDFDQLRSKAREMGAETKFSATEAADAFTYMAMAGWDAESMMQGIDGIMNLAAADGLDLATTSDIVTDALTAFGMSASDSAHFADVLATASSSANTNVSMLGESFKYVAPVAGALGYSAEDTAQALGLMANYGIKASQAGTSLRTAITNMASPTEAMEGVMNEFDITLQRADGSMKSFDEVMLDLRENMKLTTDEQRNANYAAAEAQAVSEGYTDQMAIMTELEKQLFLEREQGSKIVSKMSKAEVELAAKQKLGIKVTKNRKLTGEEYAELVDKLGRESLYGLSEAEQAAAASTLFGKEAMSGMLAVINTSTEDYDKLKTAISGADGTAKGMADTMQDNLSGQLTILKSQLEELAISIGDIMMPIIRNIVSHIQGAVDWLNSLSDSQKQMIVTVGLVVAALGPLLIIIGQVITAIGTIMTAVSTIGPAMAALGATGGPILLVVAALGLLAGAFVTAKDEAANYHGEARELSDKEEQNKEKILELRDAYDELSQRRSDSVAVIDAQSQKESELWKELQNITDENGKVKAGYEDRAAFIAGELSRTLGMEIDLTGGVIQNYQDLQSEIDNLIEKKRAEAILNAYQESYTKAIVSQKDARVALFHATQDSESATQNYNDALAEENKLQAEYNEIMAQYLKDGTNDQLRQQMYDLQDALILAGETTRGFKDHMDESNLTLEAASLALDNYNATIANYEGASSAIISGDQQKISESLMLLQNDFKTTETATAASLQAQHETIKTELTAMKAAMAEGSPAVTAEMIKELEQLELKSNVELGKLAILAGNATTDAVTAVSEKSGEMAAAGTRIGEEFSSGLTGGIKEGEDDVSEAADSIADSALSSAREALDSHSPSRKTWEIGLDYDSGLAGGITEGTAQVTDAVTGVTTAATSALNTNLSASQTEIYTYQVSIKTSWSSWCNDLINSITTCLSQISTETNTNLSVLRTQVTTVMKQIEKVWSDTLQSIKTKHRQTLLEIKTETDTSLSELLNTVQTYNDQIKEYTLTAARELVEGVGGQLKNLDPTVRGGFEPAVGYITGLIPQAREWGIDMMDGYIAGIKSKIRELESVCESIAETVSDYMHFTRPEKGPLRNYEEWMPHMMQGYAKGIRDNAYLVTDEINELGRQMAAGVPGASLSNPGKPYTINVFNQTLLDGKVISESVDEYLGGVL